jgi:hypothetical protein
MQSTKNAVVQAFSKGGSAAKMAGDMFKKPKGTGGSKGGSSS